MGINSDRIIDAIVGSPDGLAAVSGRLTAQYRQIDGIGNRPLVAAHPGGERFRRDVVYRFAFAGDCGLLVAIQRHQMYYTVKLNRIQLGRELKRMFGDPKKTTRDGRSGWYYFLSHDLFDRFETKDNFPVEVERDDVQF